CMKSQRAAFALLLLVLIPGAVAGQTIYKCAVKGKISYQSEPCPANAKIEAIREYRYVPSSYRPPAPVQAQTQTRSQSVNTTHARTEFHTVHAEVSHDECARAKARRDVVLGRNNQGGNYDVRVRLNEEVHRACR
ncbi:MAG: DUF4124 domain-containing protein, partial [Lysobacter sp.]